MANSLHTHETVCSQRRLPKSWYTEISCTVVDCTVSGTGHNSAHASVMQAEDIVLHRAATRVSAMAAETKLAQTKPIISPARHKLEAFGNSSSRRKREREWEKEREIAAVCTSNRSDGKAALDKAERFSSFSESLTGGRRRHKAIEKVEYDVLSTLKRRIVKGDPSRRQGMPSNIYANTGNEL